MSFSLKFFTYSPRKKAKILEKSECYHLAGLLYYRQHIYDKAANCLESTPFTTLLIQCYQKLGMYSKAIEQADLHGYYPLGARLCEQIGNQKKAAYFYSHFKPLYAAKLYKKENCYLEAANCYLDIAQYVSALECFSLCEEPIHTKGFKQIEEIAITLYFSKAYKDAFMLFFKLKDYYSALECAKKLKSQSLICALHLLIGYMEAKNKHYIVAAKWIEPYAAKQALLYYYLAGADSEAIRLLLKDADYDKAMNLCLCHNHLGLAYQLASTYNLSLEIEKHVS